MKYLLLLLIVGTAQANEFVNKKPAGMSLEQVSRLCSHSDDLSPIRCFLETSTTMTVNDAVELCAEAPKEAALAPVECFKQTPTQLPERSAAILCQGSSSPNQTLACFNSMLKKGLNFDSAILACKKSL